jgi:putative endonuclease
MPSFVYILTNKQNGTLYVGVTSDLVKRVSQHRLRLTPGFSSKFQTHHLVYYEVYDDMENAIHREKSMKRWARKWKLEAIEKFNPEWSDLFDEIAQ